MLKYLGVPIQAATHAPEIDNMISLVHWLMLAMFIGWGFFFVYVLMRFRKGANPRADYVGAKGKLSKAIEVGILLAEVVLLIGYAIPAWARRVAQFPSENEAVVVKVISEQFAWNVQYPGPDGKFGRTDITKVSAENPIGLDRTDPSAKDDITTINQLVLPVDRPALVRLSSKDVIHSFGLFEMRVKQDAVPGLDIPVWFIPNRIGDYEIACSQLCGLGYYRMRGFVKIKSDADFRALLAQESKSLIR